jgi:hypothetical protein
MITQSDIDLLNTFSIHKDSIYPEIEAQMAMDENMQEDNVNRGERVRSIQEILSPDNPDNPDMGINNNDNNENNENKENRKNMSDAVSIIQEAIKKLTEIIYDIRKNDRITASQTNFKRFVMLTDILKRFEQLLRGIESPNSPLFMETLLECAEQFLSMKANVYDRIFAALLQVITFVYNHT